tara:strand:- start:360 stop:461 length:102 start_codon:yes stop_codon:yes gene_type:complete
MRLKSILVYFFPKKNHNSKIGIMEIMEIPGIAN